MSKKFWYLTKVSLKKKMESKWFLVTNIILAIVIIGIINIKSIIKVFGGDFSDSLNIYVIDNANGYDIFKSSLENDIKDADINISLSPKRKDELIDSLKKNDVLVVLNNSEENYLESEVISENTIDSTVYQQIVGSINTTKSMIGMIKTNIDPEVLTNISVPAKIDRTILSDSKSADENMEIVMNGVFPTLILPFFMLVIFLVQMVGGEICEEKTTRSMEIIIANISPKLHLFSKVLASNIFVIGQGLLLIIYSVIGLLIHNLTVGGSLFKDLTMVFGNIDLSFISDKLPVLIPTTLILMILSFFAYAVISGILASMTVNIEDFNQLQSPIMITSIAGYYLAITASMFKGSLLIHILSYVPFLSAFLSPTLYIIGEINILEVLLSIVIMILFIYLLVKKGMKVYKNGILNYSTDKVWQRVIKSLKN